MSTTGGEGERTVRIGGGSAGFGDGLMAAPRLVADGALDYLMFDFLSEYYMPMAGRARANDPAAGSAPLSEAERMIAGIWERVLSRPPLGVDQNFFDCGGNSVSIARVNAELRKALGRVVPMTAMFQHSTIRSLASYITAGDESLRPQFAGDESAERGARRRSRLQRRRKVADKE